MLRVMLVDDEPIALEGLQLLIDWHKEGFEIVALCQSAMEALKKLPSAKPDLIVTDLYMPQMDGITLIRHAREAGYEGEFNIVSGYSDFEKARQALELGVSGYILKPIDDKDASLAIDAARKAILLRAQSKKQGASCPPYQAQLTAMLMGREYDADALPSGEWRLLTWGSPLPIETLHQLQFRAEAMQVKATAHILGGQEWLVLYAKADTSKALADLRSAVALAGREVYAGDAVAKPFALIQEKKRLSQQLSRYQARLSEMLDELEKTVALRQTDEFVSKAGQLKAFCEAHSLRVKEQALSLWRACCARQFERQPDKLSQFIEESVQADDVRSLGLMAIRLLSPDQQRLSDVVKERTQQGYAQNLTLERLAADLGYNAAYLGRVFREETGLPYRTYLTSVRIEKAAALIRETTDSIASIANTVGFIKYKSFLDHFKLSYGVTPDAYRHENKPE